MWASITAIFQSVAAYFGWAKQRSEVANAPDVKAAAVAKQEQAQVDKSNKAVADGDLDEIRKEAAE